MDYIQGAGKGQTSAIQYEAIKLAVYPDLHSTTTKNTTFACH